MDHEASATFRHIKKDMTVAKARKRFAKGLVGTWSIDDMLVGMRLTFREDGSGTMEEWGWDHFHLDPDYVTVPEFKCGETRTVHYDFRICKNVYNIAELHVFEPGLKPNERGEIGFWISPDPLVYEKAASGFLVRFLEKLKHGRRQT